MKEAIVSDIKDDHNTQNIITKSIHNIYNIHVVSVSFQSGFSCFILVFIGFGVSFSASELLLHGGNMSVA